MNTPVELTRAEMAALGAERCKWRRRLQEVMDKENTNPNQLSRVLGLSHNTVYRVLAGTLHIPSGQNVARDGVAVEVTLIGVPVIREIRLYNRYAYAGSSFDPRMENYALTA